MYTNVYERGCINAERLPRWDNLTVWGNHPSFCASHATNIFSMGPCICWPYSAGPAAGPFVDAEELHLISPLYEACSHIYTRHHKTLQWIATLSFEPLSLTVGWTICNPNTAYSEARYGPVSSLSLALFNVLCVEKKSVNPICLQGSQLHCLTARAHTALFSARLAFQSWNHSSGRL